MNAQRAYGWMPVLVATMVAIGWTTAARAGAADYDVPEQVVNFADLDLNSSMGASTLYRRIEAAAERVCGGAPNGRELSIAARFSSCKEQAIARAVNVVNSSFLTSLYLAKTGRADKPITIAKVP
jgi:UrcA family protein